MSTVGMAWDPRGVESTGGSGCPKPANQATRIGGDWIVGGSHQERRVDDGEAGDRLAELDAMLVGEQQVLARRLDVAQRPRQRAVDIGGVASTEVVGDRG